MKNKKILIILVCTLLTIIIAISLIIFKFEKSSTILNEYTPEEEISVEQYRETIVTLYYVDVNTNQIKSEGKLIDSASLIENPYKELINLLLENPQSENLKNPFPENTTLINSKIQGNCVILDFSNEILNFGDDENKFNIINCILNTITQLNEVNSFKILVNGEENTAYSDEYIS